MHPQLTKSTPVCGQSHCETAGNGNSATNVLFRGLGNIGSKVIYLASSAAELRKKFLFNKGIVRADDATVTNLKFLYRLLPPETMLYVDGDKKDTSIIKEACRNRLGVRHIEEFKLSEPPETQLAIDFTARAKPFIGECELQMPVIIQSNQEEPPGKERLFVPPFLEKKGKNADANISVFRVGDCILTGIMPALSKIRDFIKENISIAFRTDLNPGKGPKSAISNVAYFSDSFPKRRGKELARLTGYNTLIGMSIGQNGPFYLAFFFSELRQSAVEERFGSWVKFEKGGMLGKLFESDGRVIATNADNTSQHCMPPEPENIEAFAGQYNRFPLERPIVYYKRTQYRSPANNNFTFTIGFDVNITSAVGNIDAMYALTEGHLPLSEAMEQVSSALFGREYSATVMKHLPSV